MTAEDHGSVSTYKNHLCRCEACTAANAAYHQLWKSRQEPLAPGDLRHGTIGGYSNYNCRCDACKTAAGVQPVVFDRSVTPGHVPGRYRPFGAIRTGRRTVGSAAPVLPVSGEEAPRVLAPGLSVSPDTNTPNE